MQFDQTPSNGESMALLKAGNDLGASGAGIGLAYKDGSTEKTATSAELATGVTFDSGALTDTACGQRCFRNRYTEQEGFVGKQ